jgi:hypothetical protein
MAKKVARPALISVRKREPFLSWRCEAVSDAIALRRPGWPTHMSRALETEAATDDAVRNGVVDGLRVVLHREVRDG